MKNKRLTMLSIFVTALFLFLAYASDDSDSDSGSTSCEYSSTIAEVESCIDGTWMATPTGNIWTKVVFGQGKTYKVYTATPSSGKWPSSPSYSGNYRIVERRYSDTGKKYVAVWLDDSGLCDYQVVFDGSGTSLVCGGNNYDILRKTNESPWE